MPEALTEWKFLGFAHDNELRGGFLTGTTVTAKDLMVQPNPPRFLREGDVDRIHRQGQQSVADPANRHRAVDLCRRAHQRFGRCQTW